VSLTSDTHTYALNVLEKWYMVDVGKSDHIKAIRQRKFLQFFSNRGAHQGAKGPFES